MSEITDGIKLLSSWIIEYPDDKRLRAEANLWLLPQSLIEPTKFSKKYKNLDNTSYKDYTDEVTRQEVLAMCGFFLAHGLHTKSEVEKLFLMTPFEGDLTDSDYRFLERGLKHWAIIYSKPKRSIRFKPKNYLIFLMLPFILLLLLFINNEAATDFQINRIFSDEDNNLYIQLCGHSNTPIEFTVQNSNSGYTWKAHGVKLDECHDYKVILDISNSNTWYVIDISSDNGEYVGHVRCLTSDVAPFFCLETRIDPPMFGRLPQIFFEETG